VPFGLSDIFPPCFMIVFRPALCDEFLTFAETGLLLNSPPFVLAFFCSSRPFILWSMVQPGRVVHCSTFAAVRAPFPFFLPPFFLTPLISPLPWRRLEHSTFRVIFSHVRPLLALRLSRFLSFLVNLTFTQKTVTPLFPPVNALPR